MNIRRIIGGLLLASPFVAIFVTAMAEHGILFALSVFGAVALLIVIVAVGVELIDL